MNDDTRELIGAGLRSVANSFPVFATLAQGWSEYENHLFKTRVEEFFTEVQVRLESLEAMDTARLERIVSVEAQSALLEEAIAAASREPDRNKRRSFSDYYVAGITGEISKDSDVLRSLLQTLEALTPTDLRVLKHFRAEGFSTGDRLTGTTNPMLSSAPILTADAAQQPEALASLKLSIRKLESRGLIEEAARTKGGLLVTDGSGSPLDKFRHKFWELTFTGRQLLSFISTDH